MSYYPRRPIKSFQDLEVYQKSLGVTAVIVKHILKETSENQKINEIVEHLTQYLLDLPVLLATAHSVRFSSPQTSIDKLERAMLNCNLAVVYLELYRDIVMPLGKEGTRQKEGQRLEDKGNVGSGTLGSGTFDEQIKTLLIIRMKIMHLQMSWKKFIKIDSEK